MSQPAKPFVDASYHDPTRRVEAQRIVLTLDVDYVVLNEDEVGFPDPLDALAIAAVASLGAYHFMQVTGVELEVER
jgi:hypothetical protein